jgi:hypothetical protein
MSQNPARSYHLAADFGSPLLFFFFSFCFYKMKCKRATDTKSLGILKNTDSAHEYSAGNWMCRRKHHRLENKRGSEMTKRHVRYQAHGLSFFSSGFLKQNLAIK